MRYAFARVLGTSWRSPACSKTAKYPQFPSHFVWFSQGLTDLYSFPKFTALILFLFTLIFPSFNRLLFWSTLSTQNQLNQLIIKATESQLCPSWGPKFFQASQTPSLPLILSPGSCVTTLYRRLTHLFLRRPRKGQTPCLHKELSTLLCSRRRIMSTNFRGLIR